MAEPTTAARPYARAAFAYARDAAKLEHWTNGLAWLAECWRRREVADYVASPTLTASERATFLLKLCEIPPEDALGNFVQILSENGRLPLLPAINDFFLDLLSQARKSLKVELTVARATEDDMVEALRKKLQIKFSRQIEVDLKVDPDLISGAVVRAGDIVVDSSLRGSLLRLAQEL